MLEERKIKTALISVYHKDGLEEILQLLNANGVKMLSTGGTQHFIESLGYKCIKVEDITAYPSIFGGRVKTLHPKIFGGILSRRNNSNDDSEANKYGIEQIDLVIVDLYPFEQTVENGATTDEIIEKIDIGGISLIRAAAKNFYDVVIVSCKNDYAKLISLLKNNGAKTSIEERRELALHAFETSSNYDNAIKNWFLQGVKP